MKNPILPALLLLCSMGCMAQKSIPLDNIPQSYYKSAKHKGEVVTVYYQTVKDEKRMYKNAKVYLPYGYDGADKSKLYNVLYLLHGGNDNSRSFFDGSHGSLPLPEILDHLISEGKMEPVIVVGATYYDVDNGKVHYGMDATIDDCRNFNKELREFLIPAIEKTFNTYLRSASRKSDPITATRQHRAYGGFSMGSLSTWYQAYYDLKAVKYYLPLSGDLWLYDGSGNKISPKDAAIAFNKSIKSGKYRNDAIWIHGLTGSKDIAYEAETAFIEALRENAPLLKYDQNLRYSVLEGGEHNYKNINQYLYNVLPTMFK